MISDLRWHCSSICLMEGTEPESKPNDWTEKHNRIETISSNATDKTVGILEWRAQSNAVRWNAMRWDAMWCRSHYASASWKWAWMRKTMYSSLDYLLVVVVVVVVVVLVVSLVDLHHFFYFHVCGDADVVVVVVLICRSCRCHRHCVCRGGSWHVSFNIFSVSRAAFENYFQWNEILYWVWWQLRKRIGTLRSTSTHYLAVCLCICVWVMSLMHTGIILPEISWIISNGAARLWDVDVGSLEMWSRFVMAVAKVFSEN